jgi:3-methyladenine DNA glycosylase AlkD
MPADPGPVIAALEVAASAKVHDEMAPRYGIVTDRAFGVPMAAMQRIAKPLAPDHALAAALWDTGWYEARTVACLIDDPALVTPAQMDRWRGDFDNWAIVDTACFKLFDRVPGAAGMVEPWAALDDEFGRRAGFALLACLALHGRDADYLHGLALVEAAATDERNFVKKGVAWALRAIGLKRDPSLRAAARALAARLVASPDRTARWIGRDAARAFAKADRGREGA